MKTIDFCIPFVGSGLRYAEFLISNLLSTATHPEHISISLSVHTQDDIEVIKNSWISNVVKRIVGAPSGGNIPNARFITDGFIGSANHCSAIQSLCEHVTADVVIFSDHDMAFLVAGWDKEIIEILNSHDLCGVGYQNYTFPIPLTEFPSLHNKFACNYKHIPNLSFLAITKNNIETYFPKGISSFHYYLAEGSLPFQIVNTHTLSDILKLQLGSIWWMDSGFEIPFVIAQHTLKYLTFEPLMFGNQPVFSLDIFTEAPSTGNLPDVFVDSRSGKPLIAHFGKGALKCQTINSTPFDCFMAAVNGYLAKQH